MYNTDKHKLDFIKLKEKVEMDQKEREAQCEWVTVKLKGSFDVKRKEINYLDN